MSSIFATVQKDMGSQSRDLTTLVKQVKDILPQHSDDVVCEALIQSDEDVMRAVDLLLSPAFTTKAAKKKKERREVQAEVQAEHDGDAGTAVPAYDDVPADGPQEFQRPERPKTEAEKEASKLKKKLREIERIEERLKKAEKVDPLQLPKIEKKSELEYELLVAERKVRQEEAAREEERRRQEEEDARLREEQRRLEAARIEQERREEEEAAAREAEAEAARERAAARQRQQPSHQVYHQPPPQHSPQPQQAAVPAQPAPSGQPVKPQAMGMELLSLLHSGQAQPPQGYQQSKQMADQLSGGRGPVLVGVYQQMQQTQGGTSPKVPAAEAQPETGYHQQPRQQQHQQQWHQQQSDQQQWHQQQPDQQQWHQQQPDQQQWHQKHSDQEQWHQQHSDQQQWHQQQQQQPDAARPPRQNWAYEADEYEEQREREEDQAKQVGATDNDLMNKYSTPLDTSRLSPALCAEAERIANEIEGGAGGYKSHSRAGEWQDTRRSSGREYGYGGYGGKSGGGKRSRDGNRDGYRDGYRDGKRDGWGGGWRDYNKDGDSERQPRQNDARGKGKGKPEGGR